MMHREKPSSSPSPPKLHKPRSHTSLVIAVVMLDVFYISAGLIWTVVSAKWDLSFLKTLEASVNSAKYGHSVEHRAETIVAWLLMLSTLAALGSGAVHGSCRCRKIRRRNAERNSTH